MANFTQRMIGAAKLDIGTYEEVEADTSATGQALAVVVISSIAAGIGVLGRSSISGLIGAIVAALIGWVIWAVLAYLIGAKLLPEPQTRADVGELLRTTGFSSSPGILRVVGIIPFLNWIVNFAVAIWLLITMVIAVRQALDYRSTGRAVAVCIIGWLVYLMLFGALAWLLGVRLEA